MYLTNLGGQSRKLGLVPKKNIKLDQYGLEDVDDFFRDDSTEPQKPHQSLKQSKQFKQPTPTSKQQPAMQQQPFNNIARKINFNDEDEDETFNLASTIPNKKSPAIAINKQSPLRSPLAEEDFDHNNNNNQFDVKSIQESSTDLGDISPPPAEEATDYDIDDGVPDFSMNDEPQEYDDDEVEEEDDDDLPIKETKRSNSKQGRSKVSSSSFTKKMALGKTKRLPSFIDDTSITEYTESGSGSGSGSEQDDTELGDNDETFQDISTTPSSQRSLAIYNESNLPSPPPDNSTGLRRSKRTRIKPLAFWRNERIIYTQDINKNNEEDFDNTLARDIHNIPLRLIKEVVHIPDGDITNTRMITRKVPPKNKKWATKSRTPPPDDNNNMNYDDTEIDFEHYLEKQKQKQKQKEEEEEEEEDITLLPGSEWLKENDDCLQLTVKDNGVLKKRKIAYNQKGGNFKQNSEDSYKVASLFDQDKDFCAGGMLALPVDGFKPPSTVNGSTYMFNVIEGSIRVTLNEDAFIVTKGCKLQIPEGNEYSLRNVGKSEAYLFFVQITKPEQTEDNW